MRDGHEFAVERYQRQPILECGRGRSHPRLSKSYNSLTTGNHEGPAAPRNTTDRTALLKISLYGMIVCMPAIISIMQTTWAVLDRGQKRRRYSRNVQQIVRGRNEEFARSFATWIAVTELKRNSHGLWVKARDINWLEYYLMRVYGEERWLKCMRMQKSTFF